MIRGAPPFAEWTNKSCSAHPHDDHRHETSWRMMAGETGSTRRTRAADTDTHAERTHHAQRTHKNTRTHRTRHTTHTQERTHRTRHTTRTHKNTRTQEHKNTRTQEHKNTRTDTHTHGAPASCRSPRRGHRHRGAGSTGRRPGCADGDQARRVQPEVIRAIFMRWNSVHSKPEVIGAIFVRWNSVDSNPR